MTDRTKPKKRIVLIILGIAVLVIGVGLITWKLLIEENPTTNPEQSQVPASQSQQQSSTTSDVSEAAETVQYENGLLALKLKHPTTWKVTESENKDGVRFESPDFKYTTADKGQVDGHFRIYIRKGARSADSKYIGRGVAINESTKLVYDSPTPGQRSETNLSHFGLDQPNSFSFFLIAGNFNLKKGDVLGPNYGKEFDTYIIAGGYSDSSLKDDLATNSVSLNYYGSTNAYKQALDILKSIQVR